MKRSRFALTLITFGFFAFAFASISASASAVNASSADAAAAAAVAAAGANVLDPLSSWKVVPCVANGVVISAKASAHNKADLSVQVKLNDRKLNKGKLFTSTVPSAKVTDFAPGSAFCASDYI